MVREQSPRLEDDFDRGAWAYSIKKLAKELKKGKVRPEIVERFCGIVAKNALEQGELDNLGQIETLVRSRNLPLRVAAIPMVEMTMPPHLGSIDPRTGEERPYSFAVCYGNVDHNPYEARVRELWNTEPEANHLRLEHETGLLLPKQL